MPVKRIGYFLVVVGIVALLISVGAGFIGLGDPRLGTSQIVGIEMGIAIAIAGSFLFVLFPDQKLNIRGSFAAAVEWVLNLPVIVWVLVGFLIVYVWFFLFPVFFNAEHTIRYFNRFLPDKSPIGLDLRAVLQYIEGWLVSNKSPYADGFIAYPPLSLLLYAPLLLIGYPAYYYVLSAMTLLLHTSSALLFSSIVDRKQSNALSLLLFGLSIFSYGFQFELERGQSNVIAFSLCLIAVYLFHTHPRYRYVAYLLFTIGVQLKIYPLILLIMFVKDWRDWKGNVRRFAGILLLNAALLFVLGGSIFQDFLRAVAGQQSYQGSWNGNHSLKGFVDHLALDGFGLVSQPVLHLFQQYHLWILALFLGIIGACFLAVLVLAYRENNAELNPYVLVLCTVLALVIPSISNDYKLPILTVPMIVLFGGISVPEGGLRRICCILLVTLISAAYWTIQYPFTIKPYVLTRNFPALFLLILMVTVLQAVTFTKQAVVATNEAGE